MVTTFNWLMDKATCIDNLAGIYLARSIPEGVIMKLYLLLAVLQLYCIATAVRAQNCEIEPQWLRDNWNNDCASACPPCIGQPPPQVCTFNCVQYRNGVRVNG